MSIFFSSFVTLSKKWPGKKSYSIATSTRTIKSVIIDIERLFLAKRQEVQAGVQMFMLSQPRGMLKKLQRSQMMASHSVLVSQIHFVADSTF